MKAFLRISTDDKRLQKLHTKDNVDLLVSLLPHQVLHLSKTSDDEERYKFCINTILNNLDIATSCVEGFSLKTKIELESIATNEKGLVFSSGIKETRTVLNTNLIYANLPSDKIEEITKNSDNSQSLTTWLLFKGLCYVICILNLALVLTSIAIQVISIAVPVCTSYKIQYGYHTTRFLRQTCSFHLLS